MMKKMLHKNSWHNVAKWPPSATTPWTLTLGFAHKKASLHNWVDKKSN